MKLFRTKWLTLAVLTLALGFSSCQKKEEVAQPEPQPMDYAGNHDMPDPANEDRIVDIPDAELFNFTHDTYVANHQGLEKWHEKNHNSLIYYAAKKLGVSEDRAVLMGEAAEMPDYFQSGIQNGFAQQWSHAYMYREGGSWIWGDADDDFHDNLLGSEQPGKEGEGYKGLWAGYYYDQGDQKMGDWYVGYGLHYITDVCQPLHSTFILPNIMMGIHHWDFESWILNNWTQGHCFVKDVEAVQPSDFHKVFDLRAALKQAAWNSNYYHSTYSHAMWDAYAASGYPTGVGEGNAEAVKGARAAVREAERWAGGSMEFILNHYNQR